MDLLEGWDLLPSPPNAYQTPVELPRHGWQAAQVPGTAAAVMGVDQRDFDAEDWWFRCRFELPQDWLAAELALELDGIATVSEVFLNGEPLLESSSMWSAHRADISGRVRETNELAIACRALKPLLRVRRRPSPRWRTRVVNDGNLRWFRTMIFGRSPGFAPGPATVGPWRPVRVLRTDEPAIESLSLRPRIDGDDGVLVVRGVMRATPDSQLTLTLGGCEVRVAVAGDGAFTGELQVAKVERWWPHTHGRPHLYELVITLEQRELARRQVGFRTLSWSDDIPERGLELVVNGVRIFIRGAVWTPPDLVSMAPSETELRRLLELVRDAGMNMLRVVGTGAYETVEFHDLCDELGITVWQDLMFANLDYPVSDDGFQEIVEREARAVVERLSGRPSLTVICGNSEVEQQPAMMGLEPDLGRAPLWDSVLADTVASTGTDCAYVRSTPCGGDLPFHPDRGVTHYFGVSGYFMPPQDVRRAKVRFAAESLAFANVPDEVHVPVHHPVWKAGVQRDAGTGWDLGAGWDFDDVRDRYLELLYELDPVELRRYDHARYLELSRAVSGEVMAEVMGEWRRRDSGCQGALVLWLKDMLPGAGLGVLDSAGNPKVAYHYLRRALAPVAVWTTDEGVAGVAVHVANDRGAALCADLRLELLRDGNVVVGEAVERLDLAPRTSIRRSVDAMVGHFVDPAWAYRFGPPQQDAIVVSLQTLGVEPRLLSQAIRFPAGHPLQRRSAATLGLRASCSPGEHGEYLLRLDTDRLAYGVRAKVSGFMPDDDAFSVVPGRTRVIVLRPISGQAAVSGGSVTALNLDGAIPIEIGA